MISELTHVLLPPRSPTLVPADGEFVLLEEQLGTRLPADFHDYWKTYGAGAISDFVGILRPQQHPPHRDYVASALESLRLDQPRPATNWQAHPALCGLLPWGTSDNGDVLCWRMIDKPDSWPVAVLPPRSEEVDDYGMSMTRFLARWVSGELVVKSFPKDIVHGFTPRRG